MLTKSNLYYKTIGILQMYFCDTLIVSLGN